MPSNMVSPCNGWKSKIAIGRTWLTATLFVAGFLSVQRFTLDPVNTLVCLLPFSFFVLHLIWGQHRNALSYLLIALMLSVDNGGGVYAETPTILRFVIYVSAFLTMLGLSRSDINRKALRLGGLLIFGLAVGFIANILDGPAVFEGEAIRRDIHVLIVLSIFLLYRRTVELDPKPIFVAGLGYLFGEVLNASLFYELGADYLSYDSLKSFIVFPLLYALMTRRSMLIVVGLSVMTLSVVPLYGTRMIIFSTISLCLLSLIVGLIRAGRGRLVFVLALVAIILLGSADLIDFLTSERLAGLKAVAFIGTLIKNFDPEEITYMFTMLDPVRFAEHRLFFTRPLIQVIFGSGLGSGLFDAQGVLGFVTHDQTAFSVKEIQTSTYFNLHDFWIDFGLRFGLLPIIYITYLLAFREMWRGRLFLGILLGVMLINTTFSSSGILLTALIVRFFPRQPKME